MVTHFEMAMECLGRTIRADVLTTPEGVQVLVTGGDRAHIGAVSVAEMAAADSGAALADSGSAASADGGAASAGSGGAASRAFVVRTTEFPGHRDAAVSERWAKSLAAAGYLPAVVSAGIHYDGITREGILQVLEVSERMLAELLEKLAVPHG